MPIAERGIVTSQCETIMRSHLPAMDRLAGSGEPTVHVTFGMLGFESPAPPPLPRDDEQAG
ncbi:MAG TPA: hypothetical protein VF731_10350 [Solirubrobacterales bacterium]